MQLFEITLAALVPVVNYETQCVNINYWVPDSCQQIVKSILIGSYELFNQSAIASLTTGKKTNRGPVAQCPLMWKQSGMLNNPVTSVYHLSG